MSRTRESVGGALRAASRLIGSAFSSIPLFIWVAIGVAVLLFAVVSVAGGFRAVGSTPAPTGEIGTEVALSEYSVTVHDAEVTDAVEDQYLEAEPGDTLVVVTMTMTNTTDQPIGIATTTDRIATGFVNVRDPLLELSGTSSTNNESTSVEPTSSARVWRDDGSAGPVILQPGMPSTVRIAWSVKKDAVSSRAVHLDVYDARVTTGQILLDSDQIIWRRGELAARINLGRDS